MKLCDRPVIGEGREFAYARRLCRKDYRVNNVRLTKRDLKRIIRHALHSGFRMGRGRR